MRIVYGLGRAIFGGFFLYNGINHFQNMGTLESYAASKRNPYPHLSVKGSGALMTLAGTSLILGIQPKASALAVAAFLGATAATMHDFWNQDDPQNRQAEIIQFSKNLALFGAALILAGDTTGTSS